MALTRKQQRFVEEYLVDHNATQASIRAGFTSKRPDQAGYELLRKPEIDAAIRAGDTQAAAQVGITAARVREEIARLAFSDIRGLFDPQGNLRPLHELTDAQAASVASVEVVIKNAAAGDGHTDTIHKLKVWDKPKALEMLGKHLGLFQENANVSGTIELVWGGSQK